jgi:hypothetical protein
MRIVFFGGHQLKNSGHDIYTFKKINKGSIVLSHNQQHGYKKIHFYQTHNKVFFLGIHAFVFPKRYNSASRPICSKTTKQTFFGSAIPSTAFGARIL